MAAKGKHTSRQLENKVALITGTANGIGRAVAERFLDEGATVVGLDRVETHFRTDHTTSTYVSIVGDVRSALDNQRAVDLAVNRFGRLDVFIGNAGIYDNRRSFRTFALSELDSAFDELFGINVKGYMMGALAAVKALSESRGCIIFTSSVSGAHAGFGGALYVAAKHAITGLTKQLALELAPDVRVNAVAPGYVPTDLRGIDSLGQQKTATQPTAADLPLQVIGTAEDYASAYVFLSSDACSRIATGSVLTLDGGASIRGPRS
jgi:NAD(P)-dependent dehydrogenase (short-subunit alcohol dehydrogenase family)